MDPGPRDQTCISCNAADSLLLSRQKPINMLEKKNENESASHSVVSDSLQPYGLQPTKHICS